MSKERLAGAIKVGFAQGRVDYTETVYDELICLETEGESPSRRQVDACRGVCPVERGPVPETRGKGAGQGHDERRPAEVVLLAAEATGWRAAAVGEEKDL